MQHLSVPKLFGAAPRPAPRPWGCPASAPLLRPLFASRHPPVHTGSNNNSVLGSARWLEPRRKQEARSLGSAAQHGHAADGDAPASTFDVGRCLPCLARSGRGQLVDCPASTVSQPEAPCPHTPAEHAATHAPPASACNATPLSPCWRVGSAMAGGLLANNTRPAQVAGDVALARHHQVTRTRGWLCGLPCFLHGRACVACSTLSAGRAGRAWSSS